MAILWTEEYVLPDDPSLQCVTFSCTVGEGERGAAAVLLEAARPRLLESLTGSGSAETADGADFGNEVSWEGGRCEWSMSATAELLNSPYLVYSAVAEAGYGQAEIEAAFTRLSDAEAEMRPDVCPTAEGVRAVQQSLGERGRASYEILDTSGDAVFSGDLWVDRALPPADPAEPYPAAPPRRAPAVTWP